MFRKTLGNHSKAYFPSFLLKREFWGIYWFPRKPLKSHSMTKNVIFLEYITKITSIGPQQGLKLNSNGTQQSEFTYLIGTNKIIWIHLYYLILHVQFYGAKHWKQMVFTWFFPLVLPSPWILSLVLIIFFEAKVSLFVKEISMMPPIHGWYLDLTKIMVI